MNLPIGVRAPETMTDSLICAYLLIWGRPRFLHQGVCQGIHPTAPSRPGRILLTLFDRVDHVGIAVRDLDAAIAFYESAFGTTLAHRETVEPQGVEEAMFRVGESWIQLLRPLGPDTPV